MALTKEEVIKLLIKNKKTIRSFGVKRIGLFGSFVRKNEKEKSDIDLIVEFKEGQKNYDNFIELYFFLYELLQRKIEIITPEALNPYIAPYILKEVEYIEEIC